MILYIVMIHGKGAVKNWRQGPNTQRRRQLLTPQARDTPFSIVSMKLSFIKFYESTRQ